MDKNLAKLKNLAKQLAKIYYDAHASNWGQGPVYFSFLSINCQELMLASRAYFSDAVSFI